MNTTAIGKRAEAVARTFLEQKGMQFLAANVRTRFYELDLIMRDGCTLVVVEVKYRHSSRFGGGEASIDTCKHHRLIAASEAWVAEHDSGQYLVRIDVVVVTGETMMCHWYPNAVEVV